MTCDCNVESTDGVREVSSIRIYNARRPSFNFEIQIFGYFDSFSSTGPRHAGVRVTAHSSSIHSVSTHPDPKCELVEGRVSHSCPKRRGVNCKMTTISQSINICNVESGDSDKFPCNASAIELVSLAVAAGGTSLLFVLFLTAQVRYALLTTIAIDAFLFRARANHH
jgi:hypothetical protein